VTQQPFITDKNRKSTDKKSVDRNSFHELGQFKFKVPLAGVKIQQINFA
jgi:hypothetical protein